MDGTSRLRLLDGTTLQHGLRTACFAERTVVAAGGAVPIPERAPAVAGGAARLRRRHRRRRGAERRPGAARGVRRGARLRRCRPPGDRRRSARRGGPDHRCRPRSREARARTSRRVRRTRSTRLRGQPGSAIDRLTDGGVDYAFEVVGRPETIRLAWDAIRPGGTAVVVGLAPEGVEATRAGDRVPLGQVTQGHVLRVGRSRSEIPGLAALALSGDLDLAGVVTHVETSTASTPLSTAFAAARARVQFCSSTPRWRGVP